MQKLAMSEWAERLAGLSGDDIKRGLQDYRGEWPPTVEQFRNACIQASGVDHEHARMYRRFPPALPKPKADEDIVKAELARMRESMRG